MRLLSRTSLHCQHMPSSCSGCLQLRAPSPATRPWVSCLWSLALSQVGAKPWTSLAGMITLQFLSSVEPACGDFFMHSHEQHTRRLPIHLMLTFLHTSFYVDIQIGRA